MGMDLSPYCNVPWALWQENNPYPICSATIYIIFQGWFLLRVFYLVYLGKAYTEYFIETFQKQKAAFP
jgi:hypothetical protein